MFLKNYLNVKQITITEKNAMIPVAGFLLLDAGCWMMVVMVVWLVSGIGVINKN